MKKWELLKYCDEKYAEGFLIHKMILEIYDDYEDIPDDIIHLIFHKNDELRGILFVCGRNLQEQIDMATIHGFLCQEVINAIIN